METGTSSRLLQGPSSALIVYLSPCTQLSTEFPECITKWILPWCNLCVYGTNKLEETNSEEMLSNPRVCE